MAAGDEVRCQDGVLGTLERAPRGDQPGWVRQPGGELLALPAGLLEPAPQGGYQVPLPLAVLRAGSLGGLHGGEVLVVPVIEEFARIHRQLVETGGVRVRRSVAEHKEVLALPTVQEQLEIERVPVGRVVDGPVEVRQEGDVTIIPVLEEVAVVERRLLLREEVHVRRRRTEVGGTQEVTLLRQDVTIERLPREELPRGGVTATRASTSPDGGGGATRR